MYILDPNVFREVLLAKHVEDTFSLILQADLQITQMMVRLLHTQLDEATREDIFYCDTNRLGEQHPFYMMYLDRGFLKTTTPPVIKMADVFGKWDELPPIDPLTVKVDYDKGYITIVGVFPKGKYIQVTYSSGFATEDVDVTVLPSNTFKVYQGLPSWMVGSATTGAIELYKGLKNWERAPDKVKVKQKLSLTVTRTLDIEDILVPYLRFAPYALKPMNS